MIWIFVVGVIVVFFGASAFFGAPYVPSQRRYIKRAFTHLYPLSKKDVLIDVGSGDGVVLRVARKFGAKAVGYEINPALYGISRWLSRRDKGVEVRLVNFWREKIPDDTTVIYAFAVERDSRRLQRKVQTEANRLQRPLTILLFGSPFKDRKAEKQFEAYHLYTFRPLQQKSLTV